MGDFDYDDGLVHGHLWASEPFGRQPVRHDSTQCTEISASMDDRYDDGLVHNHGWARSA